MKRNSTRPVLERCEDRTLLSHAHAIVPQHLLPKVAAPSGFRELSAALTTDHTVYQVGRTVNMELTLNNRTNHKIDLSYSTGASPLTIWQKGRMVWSESSSGGYIPSTASIVIDPGTSMTFTGQWTATTAGAFSVHSGLDPAASPRHFRVKGSAGGVATGGSTHNPGGSVDSPGGSGKGSTNNGSATPPIISKPVTNPGPKPTPKPVMPPIVKPPVPLPHDPLVPRPPVHLPPPVHKPTPPIYARGIRPIVRPTLGHTGTTTATSTPTTTPNTLA